MLCSDYILAALVFKRYLTNSNCCVIEPKGVKHRPVDQNNSMEANHSDKSRASDLVANPKKAANTPQLADPESKDDFIG